MTGGRWGATLRPALAPAALSLPLFLPLGLPILLDLPMIYPWAADPGAASKPDVARLYLNPTGFALRTVVAIAGWSRCLPGCWCACAEGGARTLTGALGLVFQLGALTLVAMDWLLSIDPQFRSTAFGGGGPDDLDDGGAGLGPRCCCGRRRRARALARPATWPGCC